MSESKEVVRLTKGKILFSSPLSISLVSSRERNLNIFYYRVMKSSEIDNWIFLFDKFIKLDNDEDTLLRRVWYLFFFQFLEES